jgi:hypothetical protein
MNIPVFTSIIAAAEEQQRRIKDETGLLLMLKVMYNYVK